MVSLRYERIISYQKKIARAILYPVFNLDYHNRGDGLSVCVSVCPALMAYISVTSSRILIKLGGNVGTQVRLIVLKFHFNRFSDDACHYAKGENSVTKGYLTTTIYSTWNRACSASVDSDRRVADECEV